MGPLFLLHWYNTLLPSVFRPWCFAEADGRLAALQFPLCFSGPVWQRIGPFSWGFLGALRGYWTAELICVTAVLAFWAWRCWRM
jgi:hypothetical protein